MRAGGHVLVGAGTSCFALVVLQSSGLRLPVGVLLAGGVVGAVGALVPDIDHPRSTVSRRVPRRLLGQALRVAAPLAIVAAAAVALRHDEVAGEAWRQSRPLVGFVVAAVLSAVALVTVSLLVSRLLSHRGATHSLAFAGGAGLLVAAVCARLGLSPWYGALFGLGWVSHLVVDALGRRGVPGLLWPLAGRR